MGDMTSSDGRLHGKVAIVTGSSSGFGAGIALEFSREGALVVITARNKEQLQNIAQKCQEASKVRNKPLIVLGDICKESTRKELIEKTVSHFGKIDVLVNNAGIAKYMCFESQSLQNLDLHLDIHLRVPYHLTQLALPYLKASKGVVINVSSIVGLRPVFTNLMEYHIAKAALNQFTLYLASVLGPEDVKVNSLNPGFIPTEIHKKYLDYDEKQTKEAEDNAVNLPALKRCGKIEDIGKAAVYLASNDANFLTGVLLTIDGGNLVKTEKLF